jgi:hypothetical protein
VKTGTLSIRKTSKPTAVKAGKSPAAKPKAPAQSIKQKTSKRQTSASSAAFADEERRSMIAEVAYFNAEKRGFEPGHEETDWLEAEKTVDSLLGNATNSASAH